MSSQLVSFKLTPQERVRFDAQVAYSGLNQSEYLRALIAADGLRMKAAGKRLPRAKDKK